MDIPSRFRSKIALVTTLVKFTRQISFPDPRPLLESEVILDNSFSKRYDQNGRCAKSMKTTKH
jgi:hypothetical protein